MPNRKDDIEQTHDELYRKMQVEPISEEEADELRELGEGFEHAASAEELRHGVGGHHEESKPTRK